MINPPKTKFLTNKTLMAELAKCKANQLISPELGRMFLMMTQKYALKPNFRGYSYILDMQAEALKGMMYAAYKFNPEKSENPFSYFTTIMHNEFLRVLKQEKEHQLIRDDLLLEHGITPSFSAQEHDTN